ESMGQNFDFDKADPATWPQVTDPVCCFLVENGPVVNLEQDFSPSECKGRQVLKSWFFVKAPNGELCQQSWLMYSLTLASLFCFTCLPFEPNSSSSFVNRKTGFTNFFHFSKRACQHEHSKEHTLRGSDEKLDSSHNGNFWGLVELLARYDSVLQVHVEAIKAGTTKVMYLSNRIQNEFIGRIARRIQQTIFDKVSKDGAKVVESFVDFIDIHTKTELKSEADSLQMNISEFLFLVLAEMWYTILSKINIVSKKLQSPDLDIQMARGLLGGLRDALSELRSFGFVACKEAAASQAEVLGISMQFKEKQSQRRKVMPGEVAKDKRSSDPEKVFKCEVFNPVLDTVLTQLDNRMRKYDGVGESFGFLTGGKLKSLSSEDLKRHAQNLASSYPEDLNSESFENEIELFASFCTRIFKDDLETKAPIDLLSYTHKRSLDASFPNAETALRIFCCLPVTMAANER
uniref:Uncharacterized protein n=1 Tax=Latimeria chalumnae TaxID=7897 RepID=H3ADE1_LATCH